MADRFGKVTRRQWKVRRRRTAEPNPTMEMLRCPVCGAVRRAHAGPGTGPSRCTKCGN